VSCTIELNSYIYIKPKQDAKNMVTEKELIFISGKYGHDSKACDKVSDKTQMKEDDMTQHLTRNLGGKQVG
jgi:hypothetical protein